MGREDGAPETIGEAARLKRHFRGRRSQEERCCCNGGLLWGWGGGEKSAFERLIRTEEAQTCSGRRPVSTSNGDVA